ncbi:hypothetical protein DFH07DRAFT_381356 [Mycena maculata]|uniref:Uncharacterized protein n=1 Tax=Mycena maculata TaxID=230809 RepID=A0AAD7MFK4_9AGAR|nr:hypothetical protein DFH07DRAFT_381356 [Mycena maculata]
MGSTCEAVTEQKRGREKAGPRAHSRSSGWGWKREEGERGVLGTHCCPLPYRIWHLWTPPRFAPLLLYRRMSWERVQVQQDYPIPDSLYTIARLDTRRAWQTAALHALDPTLDELDSPQGFIDVAPRSRIRSIPAPTPAHPYLHRSRCTSHHRRQRSEVDHRARRLGTRPRSRRCTTNAGPSPRSSPPRACASLPFRNIASRCCRAPSCALRLHIRVAPFLRRRESSSCCMYGPGLPARAANPHREHHILSSRVGYARA